MELESDRFIVCSFAYRFFLSAYFNWITLKIPLRKNFCNINAARIFRLNSEHQINATSTRVHVKKNHRIDETLRTTRERIV